MVSYPTLQYVILPRSGLFNSQNGLGGGSRPYYRWLSLLHLRVENERSYSRLFTEITSRALHGQSLLPRYLGYDSLIVPDLCQYIVSVHLLVIGGQSYFSVDPSSHCIEGYVQSFYSS